MNLTAHAIGRMALGLAAASLLFATPCARAAISLTVNPAVITNDYVGQVTLSITNLTVGKTVTVEWWGDLNTNGVIDAGDLLLRSFQVTDGEVPRVAGVRNLNVPGDEDGLVNGQIRAVLYFPPIGLGVAQAGESLFRVFDPTGSLIAATQAFTVVSRVYPQGVTGRATAAPSGLPLTNRIVALESLVGTTGSLALTDTNGNFFLSSLPGIYAVVGLNQNGAIYNQALLVSVACGQTVTNNLVVTNGTLFIAGRVTDSASGLGIPALSVDANTPNNLFVVTFTDTNGNYALQVTTNTWSLHPSTEATSEAGYVPPTRTGVAITSASVSNVNFSLSKPTALIYGSLKDTLNHPVVGVEMSARDQPNTFHAVGRSFVPNASYSLGVQAGTWSPIPDSGDLGNRGFVGYGSNVTLVAGQATNINFIVTRTNWPTLQPPFHLSASQFQFLLSGLAGQNYTIQTSTNLGSNNWFVVLITNAPCNTVPIVDPYATNSARFYRAVVGP